MTAVITLVIIAILILAHEWGHFITARRIGIPVYEFSLGFGYKLFSVNKNGVEYSLRLIPLGGYVRMSGEEPGDMDDPEGFSNRTPLEKIRVAFAGPFMNFVLALLIFIYSYTVIGIPETSNDPVIGKVIANKPAEQAGLKNGDRILEVNGKEIDTWLEFTEAISSSKAREKIALSVERGEEIMNIDIIPEKNSATGNVAIGVLSPMTFHKQNILDSIKIGLQQTYELTIALLAGLWLMISGGASAADLAGPVGIVRLVGETAQIGTIFLLNFAAFLSINLGILNLLPIPALDGSKIVFAIIEWVRRRPIDPNKEGFIHWLGFVFLMLLIVFVTYNDIIRWIKG